MRRLLHGMFWGAVCSITMGIATLLLMAVHLWPPGQPLSVLVARAALHVPHAGAGTYALAGAGQLALGALSGAFLVFVARPVTMPSALGMGLLRWLFTGTIVLPFLGWFDFGFQRSPLLFVVTMVPHLAFAMSLAFLMHRDDERIVGYFLDRRRPRR